jgi:hypothetical protein
MSSTRDLSAAEWVKSSYSNGGGGNCVEWAPTCAVSGLVPVRDSKSPERPVLFFPADAWRAFVSSVQCGEFPAR